MAKYASVRWRLRLGRLRVFSGSELRSPARTAWIVEVRRCGSHIVMQKRHLDSTVTVPVPDHKEIFIGTLKSIIRQSQLPRDLFEVQS